MTDDDLKIMKTILFSDHILAKSGMYTCAPHNYKNISVKQRHEEDLNNHSATADSNCSATTKFTVC